MTVNLEDPWGGDESLADELRDALRLAVRAAVDKEFKQRKKEIEGLAKQAVDALLAKDNVAKGIAEQAALEAITHRGWVGK